MKDEKEVDGIYPGIPSGSITLGRLRCGDNFQPNISAEPGQSTTVDTPDSEQEVNPDVTEGDPEDQHQEPDGSEQETGSSAPASGHELEPSGATFTLSSVPDSGSAYVAVNGNVPYFTADDLTTTSFESYSSLDSMGRCGVAMPAWGRTSCPRKIAEVSARSSLPAGIRSSTTAWMESTSITAVI